jgi:hypothetical protein
MLEEPFTTIYYYIFYTWRIEPHDYILSVECIQSWHEKSMFTFGIIPLLTWSDKNQIKTSSFLYVPGMHFPARHLAFGVRRRQIFHARRSPR